MTEEWVQADAPIPADNAPVVTVNNRRDGRSIVLAWARFARSSRSRHFSDTTSFEELRPGGAPVVVPEGYAVPLTFDSVILDRGGLARRLARQVAAKKGSLLRLLLEVQGPRCEVRLAGEYDPSATTAHFERLQLWMGLTLRRIPMSQEPEPSFRRRSRNARGPSSALRELRTGPLEHVADRVREVLDTLSLTGCCYVDELVLDSSSDGGPVHSTLSARFEVGSLSII